MVPRHYGIRTDRYKLMHFYQFGAWEMYDLKEDPDELNNIYETADSDLVSELKQDLSELRKQYDDDSDVSEWSIEKQKEYWPKDR